MTFRASNAVPQEAYTLVKRAAVQLKTNVAGFISTMASSGADYNYLHAVYMTLKRANDQFNNLKTTPGLADYAKSQEDDLAYDVAAEFTAMQGEIASAIAWMDANVPTSVTVKTPSQWDQGRVIISNSFTPAQTAGFRTALQGVVDSIS